MCSEFTELIYRTNLTPDEEFFTDTTKGKINFKDYVYDMVTGLKIPPSPTIGFRYALEWNPDEAAICPTFDRFMKEVTCNDSSLEKLLLEYVAYIISGLPNNIFEKALILVGDGANGKSVFIDVIKELLGSDAYSSVALDQLDNDNHRALLVKKLANFDSDASTSKLKSSVVKKLISGDDMQAKIVYSPAFQFKNNAKLVISVNHIPKNEDHSHGIFRKLIFIPFNQTFVDDTAKSEGKTGIDMDRNIREKLFSEKQGIFNRVVESYKRLMYQVNFTDSKASNDLKNIFKTVNDPFLCWFNDHVEKTENGGDLLYTKESYDDYKAFCAYSNIKVTETSVSFGKKLSGVCVGDTERKMVDGARDYFRRGYKLFPFGSFQQTSNKSSFS